VSSRGGHGPSDEAPAAALIEAGFALEIADAPLLHEGLTLADIAHVLDLRARGIVPEAAARRLLALLLETHGVAANMATPTTAVSGSSSSASATTPAGCTPGGRGARRRGWRCACCCAP
jgi:hypothetical protein